MKYNNVGVRTGVELGWSELDRDTPNVKSSKEILNTLIALCANDYTRNNITRINPKVHAEQPNDRRTSNDITNLRKFLKNQFRPNDSPLAFSPLLHRYQLLQ